MKKKTLLIWVAMIASLSSWAATTPGTDKTYLGVSCNNEVFYQSTDNPTVSIRRDGNNRIAELRFSGEDEVRRNVNLAADADKMVLTFSEKVVKNSLLNFYDGVTDGYSIKRTSREEVDAIHGTDMNIHYEREFSSTDYEAISLPFDLPAADAAKAGLTLYRLNTVQNFYDNADENGIIDQGTEAVQFFLNKIKDGDKAYAGRPYLVKADKAGIKTIDLKNVTLELAKSKVLETSTTLVNYDFVPSVQTIMAKELSGRYVVRDGMLSYVIVHPADLPAWRWYMEPSIKGDYIYYTKYAFIEIDDENDATGIKDLNLDTKKPVSIYNLSGKRVDNPVKGNIYIINGKKVVY